MSADAVAEWLGDLKLQEYTDAFVAGGYGTIDGCMMLSEDVFDSLGVVKPGHRKRLVKGVQMLKERESERLTNIALNATDASKNSRRPPPPVRPRGTTSVENGTSLAATHPVPQPRGSSASAVESRTSSGKRPPALLPNTTSTSGTTPGQTKVPPALPSRPPPPSGRSLHNEPPAGSQAPPLPPLPASRLGVKQKNTPLAAAPALGAFAQQTGIDVRLEESDDEEDGEYIAIPRPSGLYDQRPLTKKVNLISKPVSARTHEGYLMKKGGIRGQKGWDKRWFKLQDGVLRYYKTRGLDRESGQILVSDMIEVRPSSSGDKSGKMHRFELDTPKRTWYFNAESVSEMTEWMMLIGAIIQDLKTKSPESTAGGSMANPDKAGWVQIKQNDFMQTWARRYIAIKDDTMCFYLNYDDYASAKPSATIMLLMVSLKVSMGGKMERNNQFRIVTRDTTYDCRAESKMELRDLVDHIQAGTLFALNQMQSDTKKSSTDERIKPDKVLEMLRDGGRNMMCADCMQPKPEWASINLGIMICIDCAGVHRSLGVHISKVRSTTLDEWNDSLISLVGGIGNSASNGFWEANVEDQRKPLLSSTKEERTSFIRKKYVDKAFCKFAKAPCQGSVKDLEEAVSGSNLLKSLVLIQGGLNVQSLSAEEQYTVIHTASTANQRLQLELLSLNGFEVPTDLVTVAPAATSRDSVIVATIPTEMLQQQLELLIDNTWSKCTVDYTLGMISYAVTSTGKHQLKAVESVASCKAGSESNTFIIEYRDGSTETWKAATSADCSSWTAMLQEAIAALPEETSNADATAYDKEGYLTRINRMQGTMQKPKYYALNGSRLEFSRLQGDPVMGTIDLLKVSSIEPVTTEEEAAEGGAAWFKMVESNQEMILIATSYKEMMSWVDVLLAAKGDTEED